MESIMLPIPKIKMENDESDVIDLDKEKTKEDLVYEWHSKVRRNLRNYYIVESEGSLDALMKWYIQLLKEEALNLEDTINVKTLILKHIGFFKLYFLELNCCFVDNYLDNMEEIIAIYSTVEVKSLPKKQKDKRAHKKFLQSVCRKMIAMWNIYLLNREDRIHHIMMKMKIASLSEESKELVNLIYGKLLTKQPTDKSDLAFCRCYILYQRWKTIRKPEEWEKMDEVIYNLYDRSPESVKNNIILRQILLPQNNSVLSTLIHISEKHVIICEEYFKYTSSIKIQEENVMLPELCDTEISDSILPDLNGDDEDQEFNVAYISFVKSMAAISKLKHSGELDDCMVVTIDDDDDDCQIVAVSSVEHLSEETDLVHEIFDDDGDDIEIIYFKKKEDQSTIQKEKISSSSLSFLDSIDISENVAVTMGQVSPSTSTCLPDHRTPAGSFVSTSTTTNQMDEDSSICDILQNLTPPISSPCPISALDIVNLELNSDTVSSEKKSERSELSQMKTTETQTENFVDNANFHYCGLITPPSDMPSCEHNIKFANAPVPSSVCASIESIQSKHNEIMKGNSQSDSLISSGGKSNSENSQRVLVETQLIPSVVEQSQSRNEQEKLQSDDNSNMHFQMVLEPDLESSTMQKRDLSGFLQPGSSKCLSDCELEFPKEADSKSKSVGCSMGYDDTLKRKDISESLNPDSNLVSGSCSEEVSGNLSPTCTDLNICKSPDTYNESKISDAVSNISSLQSSSNRCSDSSNISPSNPCTSTDFVDATISSNTDLSIKVQNKIVSLPCPSPDITSTSTDIQDLNKNLSRQEDDSVQHEAVYESIEYLNTEGYYSEEYLTYTECNDGSEDIVNNESVSQSNLQDGEEEEEIQIEDPVLMHNEEELSFIIEEALPIGSNVNICMDNECDESYAGSDTSSPLKNLDVQPEVVEQVEGSDYVAPTEVDIAKKVDTTSDGVECDKTVTSPNKIMYTSSEKVRRHTVDEFSKFEETIQLRWNKLKETHNLDEIFSGPILKVKGVSSCVSPDTNFDLFCSKPSTISQERISQTPSNSSANSSGDVTSPAYEGIDDFRSYYEENKNNILGVSSSPKMTMGKVSDDQFSKEKCSDNKSAVKLLPKKLPILQNSKENLYKAVGTGELVADNKEGMSQVRLQTHGKRIRIANDVIDSRNSVPHPLVESPPVLQSILKKKSSYDIVTNQQTSKKVTRPRIPRRLMNLKSLAEYNVKPNDPCIQSAPCVVIERLSESEISQWLRVSEISRKIRLEKQQAQFASTQLIFRVDYDKQTSHINENDVVRYNTPDGRQWRSNTNLRNNSGRLDEGLNSGDLPYPEKTSGKRKRQRSFSSNPHCSKKPSVFRKSQGKSLENSGKRKTHRKRKMDKGIDALAVVDTTRPF